MESLLSISLDLILAPVFIKIAIVIQSQILRPWEEDNVVGQEKLSSWPFKAALTPFCTFLWKKDHNI